MTSRRQFLGASAASGAAMAMAAGTRAKTWEGIFVIMQTPFHENLEIDEESLRKETDFLCRCRAHGIVWPAGDGSFKVEDMPVFDARPAKYYPSSASVLDLRELRSDAVVLLHDEELAREPLSVRQMALAKCLGARVHASAYYNVFPQPRYQSLNPAQQALLDDVAKRSKQTGAVAGEFSDRRGPRREIAAHARRIEVQLGDVWRVWYLVGPQDGEYLASLRPFDYSAARFRRDQVRLKPDFQR